MLVPEVFSEVMDYGIALGMRDINRLPGCWEQQIDEQWWIAVNGHTEPTKCSLGANVPPFSVFIYFNGWPAGVVDPAGGTLAAGAIANEDTLIAALQAARKAIA